MQSPGNLIGVSDTAAALGIIQEALQRHQVGPCFAFEDLYQNRVDQIVGISRREEEVVPGGYVECGFQAALVIRNGGLRGGLAGRHGARIRNFAIGQGCCPLLQLCRVDGGGAA